MPPIPKSAMTGLIRFSVSNVKPSVKLFRDVCKEIPRVMTIFDLDLPVPEVHHFINCESMRHLCLFIIQVRTRIAGMIRKNAFVQDERVIKMLVSKGYVF